MTLAQISGRLRPRRTACPASFDDFRRVLDSLAVVRLGLAVGPHLRSELSHGLLVRAEDLHELLSTVTFKPSGSSSRWVRVADRQLELLAGERGGPRRRHDFHRLLVSLVTPRPCSASAPASSPQRLDLRVVLVLVRDGAHDRLLGFVELHAHTVPDAPRVKVPIGRRRTPCGPGNRSSPRGTCTGCLPIRDMTLPLTCCPLPNA